MKALGGGGVARSTLDALETKWGVRVYQRQERKGKEGSGDPEEWEAKSGLASSRRGLDMSGEKGFFGYVVQALLFLEPISVTPSILIYPELLALDSEAGNLQIYISCGCLVEAEASHMAHDSQDSDIEPNPGSSCISNDSITRNANFVAFNSSCS